MAAVGSDGLEKVGSVETVLGLSMTSSSIGWVLLDGTDADAATLDHDHFDILADTAIDGDIAKHQSAVRGAQAIAAASGHRVTSVALTWSEDVDAKAALLLKALPEMGFDTVCPVSLPEAARLWAGAHGRALGYDRCAVCVVEATAVTVAAVLYDTVRTARTQMRESADGLARWLTEAFENLRAQPEGVYLMGSRGDLGLIAGPLGESLPIPVVATDDAQLVLARGAALKLGVAPAPARADERPTSRVTQRPRAARRYRFGAHARAATALVAGAIALFAVLPELVGGSDSGTREAPPVAGSSNTEAASNSTTSVRVLVSPPPAAPAVQPLGAVPAPPPAPAVAPPAPEVAPVSEPAVEAPITESTPVQAEPVGAQPAEAVPVEAQPAVSSPEPVLAQPVATAPAPQAVPTPPAVAAPPAPPVPAAPIGGAPQNPLAPPDPIAAALSPIFGGLP